MWTIRLLDQIKFELFGLPLSRVLPNLKPKGHAVGLRTCCRDISQSKRDLAREEIAPYFELYF